MLFCSHVQPCLFTPRWRFRLSPCGDARALTRRCVRVCWERVCRGWEGGGVGGSCVAEGVWRGRRWEMVLCSSRLARPSRFPREHGSLQGPLVGAFRCSRGDRVAWALSLVARYLRQTWRDEGDCGALVNLAYKGEVCVEEVLPPATVTCTRRTMVGSRDN